MLEAAPGFVHARFYLSAGRTLGSAGRSLPVRLPDLARHIRAADIAHVHGDAAAIITSSLLANRPSVITTHGLHLMRRSTGAMGSGVRLGIRCAVAVSDSVIATSHSELTELAQVVRPRDQTKLGVILNGVRPATPVGTDERAQIRAALGIDASTILGLFAGELEDRKDPLLAAAAADRVRQAGIPFVLAFAGDGPLSATLQADASEAVMALGFRHDLGQLMSAADVFVHPSSREGMSLAVLEAMSHGLPVVAADTPGNAEAVGDNGVLFAAKDVPALADAIKRICASDVLRGDLGRMSQLRASTAFDLERFQSETVETYEAVLREPDQANHEGLV